MEENKKYILLQNNYSVAYTDNKCFVDRKECKKEDGTTILSAEEAKKMAEDHKQILYNTFLKKHYKHIVVLTAAGTSLDNGNKSGKTRDGLWTECLIEIDAFDAEIDKFKENEFYTTKNIEDLLSFVILFGKVNKDKRETIERLQKALEKKIKESCTLEIDITAPHKDFLNKVTARKNNDARIQLFTTNYDTLFEKAANQAGFIVIDGFSFTQPREFAGKWFDLDIVNRERTRLKQEESFVSNVFHLYKLHGSLNWIKENDKIIQKDNSDNPLIIYPASEKYESSYEQPYFEMMSRFQQALRKEDTLLIVIGFGFQDKHIKNVIIEAVNQNPSFQLLIVNYNNSGGISTENIEEFFSNVEKNDMKVNRRVNIVFDTFKSFTDNFPENQTYYSKEDENQTI